MHLSSPFWLKATFRSWFLCMPAGGNLQRLVAQLWLVCRRLLLVPASGIDSSVELQQIGDVARIFLWLGSVSRCVPFSSVYWVVAKHDFVTWSMYLPTCGRPLSATSGFRKAKLSATSPLWKLVMSQWCGAARPTPGHHCAGRGGCSCSL